MTGAAVPAAFGGTVQPGAVPGEVLFGFRQPDTVALLPDHGAHLLQRDVKALFRVGRRVVLPAQGGTYLGEQPRSAHGAARDHDAVASGFRQHGQRVRRRVYVAVCQYGYANRLLDSPDDSPVDAGRIALRARAPVDAQHGGACRFADPRQLRGVERGLVKAGAQLDRDGKRLRRPHNRLHDASGECRIAHQSAAFPVSDNFADGTAHVDIHGGRDDVSRPTAEVAGRQPRRRLRHDIRLMSEQLDCHGHFVRHDRCQLAGYDAGRIRIPDCLLQAQCLCGYHFADRVCRSEAAAHPAEGAVCNARHGSERQPVPDHDLPALHISHGLPFSSAFWIFSVCYCTILCGNCQQRMPIVAGSPCHTDARPG